MVRIGSVVECSLADRITQEEFGIPGGILMENAGIRTVDEILLRVDQPSSMRFLVVTGKGNNGGDGFVIARHLFNRNFAVSIIALCPLTQLKNDARNNAEIATKLGIEVIECMHSEDLKRFLDQADCVIDAILGIGITEAVTGYYADVISEINMADVFRVAVDIPSGMFADRPDSLGICIHANLTVTYGLLKPALVLYPSADHAGEVVTVDISLPKKVTERISSIETIKPIHFEELFTPRKRDGHKGTYGHVLVVAGSTGKTGAAVLSSRAALRAGAGLVTLAIPTQCAAAAVPQTPEIMTLILPGPRGECLGLECLDQLRRFLPAVRTVLLGPGLGTDPETAEFIQTFVHLVSSDQILILDADALNCLSNDPSMIKNRRGPSILTPHPGEMARISGTTVKSVLSNPIASALSIAENLGVFVVLKTARTLVCCPDKRMFINVTGNPGMATAGSGDVLAGLITGLAAMSDNHVGAVLGGVCLHGIAGDLAFRAVGETSLIASDILDYFPKSQIIVRKHRDRFTGNRIPIDYSGVE